MKRRKDKHRGTRIQCTIQHYSAQEKNDLLSYTIIWRNLTDITSKRSQTQKPIYGTILYMKFRITRQLGSNILFSTLVTAPQIYDV